MSLTATTHAVQVETPKSVRTRTGRPPTAAKINRVSKAKNVAKTTKVVDAVKPAKIKKPKMVRGSLSIPKDEYAVLAQLKTRALKLGMSCKKSELLRAGIKALSAMSDTAFQASLKSVPNLKTGQHGKAK